MKMIAGMVALALVTVVACAGTPAAPKVETEEQKTLYALGLMMSNTLKRFNLTEQELDIVLSGARDSAMKREEKVDITIYGPKVSELAQARTKAGAESAKVAGVAFLEKAAAEKGAVKAPGGFVYQETQAGTGEMPKPTDKVKVHYRGTLTDGTEFDSSIKRNEPAVFPLTGVIPCWTQGLQMMKVGGKAKLVCPPEVAYGDQGRPPVIPPAATLVFEVELISIEQ